MHTIIKSSGAILIILLLLNSSLQSQITDRGTRYGEEEVQLQDLYIRANQKKILQKYDEAIDIYKQILTKEEVNPAVHHDMARIYLALEKQELAIASAIKASRYEPDNIWYLMTLAQIYEGAIEPARAAEALSKVVAISPNEDLYDRWAVNLEHAGQKENAIRIYDQADQIYGWSLDRSDSKVDLYLALNKEKDALKEIEKWTKKYPEDIDAWIRLARYQEFRGDDKKAERTYLKILDIDPNNEEALYKSQEEKIIQGDGGDLANFIADERIQLDKKIAALLPALESDAQSILPYCATIVQLYPEEAKAFALYGDALWLSNRAEEAVTQYQKALGLNKGVYQVWEQLMITLSDIQDYDQLNDVSEDAIDFYPNQAGPYHFQAVALYYLEDFDGARDANEEALFIAGQDSPLLENIAILNSQILVAQGDSTNAIQSIVDMGEEQQTSALLELLGDLYVQAGDKVKAEEAWKKSLEKGGVTERLSSKINSL